MVDTLLRQARLIVPDQSDAILAANVFGCDDHKLVPVDCGSKEAFLIIREESGCERSRRRAFPAKSCHRCTCDPVCHTLSHPHVLRHAAVKRVWMNSYNIQP